MIKLKCKICSGDFFTFPSQVKYFGRKTCSYKCAGEYRKKFFSGKNHPCWKEKIKKMCPICSNTFKIDESDKHRKTCSRKCAARYFSITYVGENATRKPIKFTKKCYGYTYRLVPKHPFANKRGYYMEHRLVMEKHIGRYLTKKEVVHHINGKESDNRIENLMLFPNNSLHRTYHAVHGIKHD